VNLYRAATRIGVAMALVGSAFLPLVDRTPDNSDRVLAVIASIVAAVLVASVVLADRIPAWATDVAAVVAALALFTDGWESILSHEQRTSSIYRTVLLTWGAGVVALTIMLDARRQRGARL